MILNVLKSACISFLVLSLIACSNPLKPLGKTGELSRDDFMNAMRWKQFTIAASHIVPEHSQDFLKTFTALKDIHIVDVRLINLQTISEGRQFETAIEMDYYLLPSVTLKTFSYNLTWVYFDGDDPARQGFLINTPFPDFP